MMLVLTLWQRIPTVFRALLLGTAVALAGTVPWAYLASLNIKHLPALPWAVLPAAVYLWLFWRYLSGAGWPRTTSEARRVLLRANPISEDAWGLALFAGVLGIAALLIFSSVLNRLVVLPPQSTEGLEKMPMMSVLFWVLMGSVVAGVVEESSFRGYMQGPIERRYGPAVAIVLTGIMFGFGHFSHPEVGMRLLPFYMFAAAVYGGLAYATNSILPSMVLHTVGDIFGALQLLAGGQSEWQTPRTPKPLVWHAGADASFWIACVLLIGVGSAAFWAYRSLAKVARPSLFGPRAPAHI